jgi:hypothetical protein
VPARLAPAAFTALLALTALLAACKYDTPPPPPPLTQPFTDTFERASLGADWRNTADPSAYTLADGALHVSRAYNHPLWLTKPIPRDATLELDCSSASPDGDIKVEIWGDGRSHAETRGAYTSSGYVFIFGGWRNSLSKIARGTEHDDTHPSRRAPRVEPGKTYHFKIVRKGGHLDWFVDDMTTPFLTFDDPHPFEGPDHMYFAFDDWEAPLTFDNLVIRPG